MPLNLQDLSAEELIARGIAPIRKQYRLSSIRFTKPDAAAGTGAAAAPTAAATADATGKTDAAVATADDSLEAAGAAGATSCGANADAAGAVAAGAVAAGAAASNGGSVSRSAPVVAADGEGGHKRVKSKKQRKKERQQHEANRICVSFMLGSCAYGDSCRFNHDVEAYMAAKPADLPGTCPFSNQPKCPYGLSCRWAGTHRNASTQQQSAAAAAAAADPGANHQQQQQQQQSEGAVPQFVTISPFSSVDAPLNTIGRQLQEQLRRRQYDFSKANEATAEVKKLVQTAAQAAESGRNGKQQQQQGDKGDRKQVLQAADADSGPATKRQKVEPAAAAAVAPAAEAAVADSVMQDAAAADTTGAATDSSAPTDAGLVAAAAAAAAIAAATVATASAADVDDLDQLYDMPCPITPHNSLVVDIPVPAAAAAVEAAAAGAEANSTVQQSDAALLAALKQEQQQQQQQQQQHQGQQEQQQVAVGGVVDSTLNEPRNRPKLDIAGKTYLAPLTTVGNLPFRRVCVDLGCEVTCGEMSLATNLLQGQGSEWALLKRHPSEKFFGVQVCGGYTDQMAQVAQLLDDQLGDNIDFVDINCGCPIDVICNKGAGSSLLLRPRRLEEVVRAVTGCINKPVIVKIRKGYYDNTDVAHDIIPQMPLWGAAAVTLHGRSRQQRYSRAADWDYIRRCAGIAQSVGLPLIGNGDVFSPQEWQQRLAAAVAAEPEDPGTEGGATVDAAAVGCGVTTAMIGRAALIKPWIFTEIRENRLWDISGSERLDIIKAFASHGLEAWGSDSRGVETTRRFMLEWLSFTHRYIPVGLLEVVPQVMSWRPPAYATRSQLEGLLSSEAAADWVKISEMFLGPAPAGFTFVPKHKSNAYTLTADAMAQLMGAAGKGAVVPAEEEEGEENG